MTSILEINEIKILKTVVANKGKRRCYKMHSGISKFYSSVQAGECQMQFKNLQTANLLGWNCKEFNKVRIKLLRFLKQKPNCVLSLREKNTVIMRAE